MYRCPCWNFDETRCEFVQPDGVCLKHQKTFSKHFNLEKYTEDLEFSMEIEELVTRFMRVKMLTEKRHFEFRLKVLRKTVEDAELAFENQRLDLSRHFC